MKKKDKARYSRSKFNFKKRLILSKGREVRFVLTPNRNNQIRHLDIQELKATHDKLEVISQIRIHHRHLDLFFKTVDDLKEQLDKEVVIPFEPETKRHRYR